VVKLTDKQRRFVSYYLGVSAGNATDAARRAGYLHPDVLGARLVRKSSIRAKIEAQLGEAALTADEIVSRLSAQAESSMADFIRVNKRGSISLRLDDAQKRGQLGLIKRGKYGWEIELYDAQKALELLGRYRGLWRDVVRIQTSEGKPRIQPRRRRSGSDSSGGNATNGSAGNGHAAR
jgi:hypothetical protein